MIRDVFCCFKKVGRVVFCIFCNNSLQGERSSRQDVIIEYKEAADEHTNEDDYSIIDTKNDTEVDIPYIDDDFSDVCLADVDIEKKHLTHREDEKVLKIFMKKFCNY